MSPSTHTGPSVGRLPDAVLWDMDGTLVDTEPYWIAAETSVAERAGGTWTHEDGMSLIGHPLTFTALQLRLRAGVQGSDAEIIGDLLSFVVGQVRAHGVPWRPGARELLEALLAARVPCALVTSAYAPLASAVVEAAPEGVFHEIVTGEQVLRGKPDPEPYLTGAARLGVEPGRCVAIEDSLAGLASAEAAGTRVIGVQAFIPIPQHPGRSRLARLDQITLEDLRAVVAGHVIDLL